jgi:hypothetical protein
MKKKAPAEVTQAATIKKLQSEKAAMVNWLMGNLDRDNHALYLILEDLSLVCAGLPVTHDGVRGLGKQLEEEEAHLKRACLQVEKMKEAFRMLKTLEPGTT